MSSYTRSQAFWTLVQQARHFSSIISDLNAKRKLKPEEPGYKCVHLDLRLDNDFRHVHSSVYSSVSMSTPLRKRSGQTWILDAKSYDHKQVEDDFNLELFRSCPTISLDNYKFMEFNHTFHARHFEAKNCHAGRWSLKVSLPECETLKLELYQIQQLRHYDWPAIA